MIQIMRHRHLEGEKILPTQKFLTFQLGKQIFACDILKVQEIKGSRKALSLLDVSHASASLKGLLYLHEQIIPIIDMSMFLNIPMQEIAEIKIIIILKLEAELVGFVVDMVSDIIELTKQQIKYASDAFPMLNARYIAGVGTIGEQLYPILNLEHLVKEALKNYVPPGDEK